MFQQIATPEQNEAFVNWLKQNGRSGYVEAFIGLQQQRPDVLRGLDFNDWVDIFLKLKPAEVLDPSFDLCDLFSSFSI